MSGRPPAKLKEQSSRLVGRDYISAAVSNGSTYSEGRRTRADSADWRNDLCSNALFCYTTLFYAIVRVSKNVGILVLAGINVSNHFNCDNDPRRFLLDHIMC